jgi:hypothetical protein
MYLAVPTQFDCVSAWREAVRLVDKRSGHTAYNVIVDVEDPVANATRQDLRVAAVDEFLGQHGKSVETIANTIFPAALYYRYGAPAFFDIFRDRVLNRVRRSERWSGYYFVRMMQYSNPPNAPMNQLWDMVERMRDDNVRALNKFELSLFDPLRDVDKSPYGGQCLSFLSFKLHPGTTKTLTLTAMYRNHYYIEKLLGNLIGLGRLMAFIAQETGSTVGPLTIVSTHAVIDQPGCSRADVLALLERVDQAAQTSAA